jgi:hypothetical protein
VDEAVHPYPEAICDLDQDQAAGLPEIHLSAYDQTRESEGDVTRRPVVQVTWSPNRPDEFGVYFTDASADSRPGGREEAQAFANSHGFQSVPTPDDSLLWSYRDPIGWGRFGTTAQDQTSAKDHRVADLSGPQGTGATGRATPAKLKVVSHFVRRCLVVGTLAIGLAACGGAAHGPPAAVLTVCNMANIGTSPTPSHTTGISTKTVREAESLGGSVFASVVNKWLATTEPSARIKAAYAVVRECQGIGGFLRS